MYNFVLGFGATACVVGIFEMFRQGYVSLSVLLIIVSLSVFATFLVQSIESSDKGE
tara:strand:+ start:311 stop:478 length:168 start_codon:yes stop_codon:yes gene_type:complete